MSRVGGESLGNNEKSIGKGINTPLGLALDCLAECFAVQVCVCGDLEGTTTRYNATVDDHVVDTAQTITDGVLDLSDGVCVGALDEKSDRLGLLDILDESVLLLSELVLVDIAGVTKDIGCEVVDAVLSNTAANELQSLHVSSLCATESENAVLDQDIQTQGVDSLLVDDDEALGSICTANLLLQLDNLAQLLVNESTLTLNQLLSLIGA